MMRLVSLHLSNDRILWGTSSSRTPNTRTRTWRRSSSVPSTPNPGTSSTTRPTRSCQT
ncbi:hypothetical protein P9139_04495 [Curtobacterium flaccumfaciens]|nr:hypothetical protein P9139_04495 [Curtobacterium flaccumfaciens]